MKNILRFSYMVLLSLVAFAISSCTSDYDYTGAPKVANEVYFSNTQQSKIELSKSNSSFVVTLHRVETKGELTVLLNYTPDEGSIFSVPNHVTFADGEAEALLPLPTILRICSMVLIMAVLSVLPMRIMTQHTVLAHLPLRLEPQSGWISIPINQQVPSVMMRFLLS